MNIHKGMTNVEIAELLRAVAAAYRLKDEKNVRFKVVAYERAADAVEHLSSEAKDLWDDNELEEISGIGESIANHLGEIFKTGNSKHFEELMKDLPPAIFDLLKVSGIGAKTAYRLAKELNISAKNPIAELEEAAKKGKIEKLEGFQEDSQKAILEGIKEIKGREDRLLLPYAQKLADEVIDWLKKSDVIERADALGSLRRRASTVGDIDIAVASKDAKSAIEHFTKYPNATRVLERGDRSASIIVPGNKQVDFMVEKPTAYGSLLQHFTGSKHHNIALREYALKRGMSLSDYGIKLKKGAKVKKSMFKMQNYNSMLKIYQFATEEEFYNAIGMEWIPPELREDQGEIEAVLSNKIPNLVKIDDIRADLQIHSDFDIETSHDLGASTMEEIINKANELGYEYLAFTEHNPSQSRHSEKQIIDILKRKKDKVGEINDSFVKKQNGSVKKVFNSLEIDILPGGRLPVSEKSLEILDFALVSIHSSFRQDRKKMTKRILSALSAPKVKVFAHPTGRKLTQREGVEIDWDQIFDFCKKNNKWLEINAEPMRLDLPDFLVKDAVENGLKLTMGTDAHHIDHMDNMRFGVYVARRGWAGKDDIVNTRSLEEFEKMIE
jgi:DNA polymerase (family X)